MRQRVFAIVFALVALLGAVHASGAAAKLRVSVRPSIGKQRTSFVVRFRAPSATGSSATLRTHFEVSATARRGRRCTASVSVTMGPTERGQAVGATLTPKGPRHIWCARRFHGRIVEISRVVCRPLTQMECPDIEIAPMTIAHFSFRVKKSTHGSTGTPRVGPTFAGLVSAVSRCPPIQPQIIPVLTHVYLTWTAATDPNTSSSKIVYDIYYSRTSGGENYSKPTWTTAPGVTHFTGVLDNFESAFFVVRARDTAGREDHNTVQRMANSLCIGPPT